VNEPKQTLLAFQTLFPKLSDEHFFLTEESLSEFPMWLRAAAAAYTLKIIGNERMEMTLIRPKERLSFDQLMNVYRQVSNKTGPNTLLIADDLNPKHRPLLVKFGIPFVFRSESIFAPNLALVFKRLQSLNRQAPRTRVINENLHPLALKLLAGFLLGKLPEAISLQLLIDKLSKNSFAPSRATLSDVMNALAETDFVKISGAGPQKRFHFPKRQETWAALKTAKLAPFMKVIRGEYDLPKKSYYVLSGESALSEYSELASPKIPTIAISSKKQSQLSLSKSPHEMPSSGLFVQIWKTDPKLFSIDGRLNPIELYFSMREHPDERVQSALQMMLSEIDLKMESNDGTA